MTIQLEAPCVAHLCDATGMPRITGPFSWNPDPEGLLDEPSYLILNNDTSCLLARRLYKALTGDDVRVAWVVVSTGGGWVYLFARETNGRTARAIELPGVPSHVTDPHEALAWAVCWWCNVERVRAAVRGCGDCGPNDWDMLDAPSWDDLRCYADSHDLPLWLPLRDGELVSLERET